MVGKPWALAYGPADGGQGEGRGEREAGETWDTKGLRFRAAPGRATRNGGVERSACWQAECSTSMCACAAGVARGALPPCLLFPPSSALTVSSLCRVPLLEEQESALERSCRDGGVWCCWWWWWCVWGGGQEEFRHIGCGTAQQRGLSSEIGGATPPARHRQPC